MGVRRSVTWAHGNKEGQARVQRAMALGEGSPMMEMAFLHNDETWMEPQSEQVVSLL